jgi:hypothetical protein
LGTALDNLTLAAANKTTVQQLKAANLDLVHTTSNATLTAANKKLSEASAKALATTPGMPREIHPTNKPFPGNYCWTHDHHCSQNPASHEFELGVKAVGRQDTVTASNTIGGSKKGKRWNTRCT